MHEAGEMTPTTALCDAAFAKGEGLLDVEEI